MLGLTANLVAANVLGQITTIFKIDKYYRNLRLETLFSKGFRFAPLIAR